MKRNRLIHALVLLAVSSGVALAAPANPLIRPVAALPQPATTGNPPIPPAPTAPGRMAGGGGEGFGGQGTAGAPGAMTAQELKTAQTSLQNLRVVALSDGAAVLRSVNMKVNASAGQPGVSGGFGADPQGASGAQNAVIELLVRDGDTVMLSGLTLTANISGGLVQLRYQGAILFQGRVSGGITVTPVTVIQDDRAYVLRRSQSTKNSNTAMGTAASTNGSSNSTSGASNGPR